MVPVATMIPALSPQGFFITFEGGEGVGKSTQIRLLAAALATAYPDRKIILTREPGGTQGGEELRALVVQGDSDRWDPVAEAMLYMAARRDHLHRVIWPALAHGDIVLCDRFVDSSYAYQGYGHGLDLSTLHSLYALIAQDFKPDLTLILDMDPTIGLGRTRNRGGISAHETRFENRDLAFHQRLRQGFLTMAKAEPHRFRIFDADQETETLARQITDSVLGHLMALDRTTRVHS